MFLAKNIGIHFFDWFIKVSKIEADDQKVS